MLEDAFWSVFFERKQDEDQKVERVFEMLQLPKGANPKEIEKRLSELAALHYPNADEQMEESTLKKKKLYLKDRMESILRRYKEQQHAAGQ